MVREPVSPRQERPVRVMVQQDMLPQYRVPVFEALASDPRLDVTFVFGEASRISAMKSVEGELPFKTRRVQNVFFPKDAAWIQRGLVGAFCEIRPDVVVMALNPRNLSLNRLERRARGAGAAVVRWGHGIRPSGRMRALYAAMVNRADRTLLYYPQAADDLVSEGVPREKLRSAWNSIDTGSIARLAAEYGQDRQVVSCIGRMIPGKKAPLLVRGFAEARAKGLRARLEIIGSGPDMAEVEALVERLGLAEVTVLHGPVFGEEEIAQVMNRSFVSVSPGYVGLNAVHSLAYGVPLLYADNEPHSPEIVALTESGTSLTFTAGDAGDLADRLIALEADRGLLQRYSALGKEYVLREFSAEKMAANIAETIVEAHRVGPG